MTGTTYSVATGARVTCTRCRRYPTAQTRRNTVPGRESWCARCRDREHVRDYDKAHRDERIAKRNAAKARAA